MGPYISNPLLNPPNAIGELLPTLPLADPALNKQQMIEAANPNLYGRDSGVEETSKVEFKNPLDNPKIAKEIQSNPDAVYGYSPKQESPLNKFGVDRTNPDEVAFARAERMKYLEKLKNKKIQLKEEIAKLEEDGLSIEAIARLKVEQRNQERMETYIKSNNIEGLKAMKERNLLQYGRAEGPTHEQLFEKYGSWEAVIYGSLRTNPAMDVLTGLYDNIGGN
ncbi:hypothetical protein R9X47_02385 [Wukongibacter baidiensis]|uniref:hypothetical protein n=1 Tax=Wukongibacter baidiensis TaxID=1723361 RepID=UPI003D7FFBDE